MQDIVKATTALNRINNKSYFVLKNIDLKDVRQLRFRYSSKGNVAAIDVHTDAPDGQVIGTAILTATGAWEKYEEATTTVIDPGGKYDLYFVFVKNDVPDKNLASLDWIKFEGGNEVKAAAKKSPVKARFAKSFVRKKVPRQKNIQPGPANDH